MFSPGDVIIPSANPYPDGVMCVVFDDGTTLRAYPEGGGFELSYSGDARMRRSFRKVMPHEVPSEWRRGMFSIDGGTTYPGRTRGYRWNGWACPVFERDVFARILDACEMPYTYEPAADTFRVTDPHNDPWEAKGGTVDGVCVYDFDGWCWEEVTHDGEEA